MKMWLIDQMVRPALHRVGTAVGGSLAGAGYITGDQQVQVQGAVALLAGLLIDFVTRKLL